MPFAEPNPRLTPLWIEAIKETIRTNPDGAEQLYFDLGAAYGDIGRYREEIEAYKQAIRIKPDYPGLYKNLGAAYLNLGLYQEAIEACK